MLSRVRSITQLSIDACNNFIARYIRISITMNAEYFLSRLTLTDGESESSGKMPKSRPWTLKEATGATLSILWLGSAFFKVEKTAFVGSSENANCEPWDLSITMCIWWSFFFKLRLDLDSHYQFDNVFHSASDSDVQLPVWMLRNDFLNPNECNIFSVRFIFGIFNYVVGM